MDGEENISEGMPAAEVWPRRLADDFPPYQGERVIWLRPGEVPSHQSASSNWRLLTPLLNIILIVWLIYVFSTSFEELWKAILMGAFIGAFSVWFLNSHRTEWFRAMFRSQTPPVYSACLITDRRVLLFNSIENAPVAFPRNRIRSVKRDYAQGSPALIFRWRGESDIYTFISSADLMPALRALDL